ncbi:MAG: hypothetical protein QOI04_2316 [Verrucomicrobiota bacterium]|jgi:LysM repeat protein
MKWLFVLGLALIVFGGAAYFGYNLFLKPDIKVRQEKSGEVPVQTMPDVGLPEFQAAAQLRQEGKLNEARAALSTFIQKYPTGTHSEEAKDLLGEIDVQILLSNYPSPEKQEYIVKKGDVLATIARKMKSTPEIIMRTNGMERTMLHIGERLFISHPEFTMIVQRKAKAVTLLDHSAFFKRYHVLEVKLPSRQSAKINTRIAEIMAWRGGKRVGFGSKEYPGSTRWVRLSAPGYLIYSVPDSMHPASDAAPPAEGLGLAASDVEELSGLVNSKTTVTITD